MTAFIKIEGRMLEEKLKILYCQLDQEIIRVLESKGGWTGDIGKLLEEYVVKFRSELTGITVLGYWYNTNYQCFDMLCSHNIFPGVKKYQVVTRENLIQEATEFVHVPHEVILEGTN